MSHTQREVKVIQLCVVCNRCDAAEPVKSENDYPLRWQELVIQGDTRHLCPGCADSVTQSLPRKASAETSRRIGSHDELTYCPEHDR